MTILRQYDPNTAQWIAIAAGESGVAVATPPVTYNASTKTVALSVGTGLTTSGSALVPDFGTTTGKVAQGDDSRFTDARTPTAHKTSHQSGGSDALDLGSLAGSLAQSQVTNLTTDLRRALAGSNLFLNLFYV